MLVLRRDVSRSATISLARSSWRPLQRQVGGLSFESMGSAGIRLLSAVLAAVAAGAVVYVLRFTAQVRSVPERLLEWMLIVVPPQAFETALMRFGFDTKRYALWGASLGLLALMAAVGFVVLSRRWSVRRLLGLGVGVWLLLMLLIMPLTDAGVFAT